MGFLIKVAILGQPSLLVRVECLGYAVAIILESVPDVGQLSL